MKKILFLLVAATISITAMSQGNSKGKGNGHGKHDKNYNNKNNDDDRYDRNNNDNGRYDERNERNNNNRWNNNNQNNQPGKYSKNTPSKVGNAFYRDYPNAGNVSWTKSKGVWTAHFGNGLFNRTVSYRANGQRVDGNYYNRRNYSQDNRTGLDKILRRSGIGVN